MKYRYTGEELERMETDEIVALFDSNELFRSACLADMANYAIDTTERGKGIFSSFADGKYSYAEHRKLEDGNRAARVYWLRAYVEAKARLERTSLFRKNAEAERTRKQGEISALDKAIPAEFKGCSLSDFNANEGQAKIVAQIRSGHSLLLCGPQGIGKTRLGWALWKSIRQEEQKSVAFLKMFELQKKLADHAMAGGGDVATYINEAFVFGIDVLILDEVDKISVTDATFSNFSYLIDRRYEEHRQTVLFGNGTKAKMEEKLGTSMLSRFSSKTYKSRVVELSGESRRATA